MTLPSVLAPPRTPAELGLDGIAHRAKTIEEESYFEVLGVVDGASADEVRAAYLRLSKTWHPDKLVADFQPLRGDVAKVFARMTAAQKTLCDPTLRRAYVEKLAAKARARPRADVLRDIAHALASRTFDAALRHCDELRVHDTDDAEALALHAWASVRAGEATDEELRTALTKLDKAVNVDRTSVEAVYYRGLVYKRLGNTASAFRDFARAVQMDPQHLRAEREVRLYAMRVRKASE
jgi:curved DNA-binding protein CbpA